MEYDIFLFTRDEKDYGWRIKPDYLQNDLYKYCKSIIELRHSVKNKEDKEWEKIWFAFMFDDVPILARIITTDAVDPVGRPIFSFEGVTLEKKTKKNVMDIPNILSYLCQKIGTFRNDYVNGMLEKRIEIPTIFNPLEENQNIIYGMSETENNQFKRLLIDVGNYEGDYSFVFGWEVEQIYHHISQKYNIRYCYDTSQFCDINKYQENNKFDIPIVKCENVFSLQRGKLCIQFINNKKNAGYKWILVDRMSDSVCGTSDVKEFFRCVKIEELSKEKECIETFLSLTGWVMEVDCEEKENLNGI